MTIEEPRSSQLSALRSLWQEAFGDTDEFLDTFFQTAFSPARCRCITIHEEMAAALYWFDCLYENSKIAYIYAVATANAFRRQGLCHKLMTATHAHLEKLGYQGALLVPGNQGLFDLYQDMGYETCSSIQEIHCNASFTGVALRPIDKNEYASLRRQFLPRGGIVQEKENLSFLETQALFYAGMDFVLAAQTEGDTLYGVELLGNTSAASDIVRALGCTKGTFRTPGTGKPFAMYHPLGNSQLPAPNYFGVAFD